MRTQPSAHHLSWIGTPEIDAAVTAMAAAGGEARGAVLTKPEVVKFILDLAGYTTDRPFHRMRLLEPSMGHGNFLLPAIDRLLADYRRDVSDGDIVRDLGHCMVAVELHEISYETSHQTATMAGFAEHIAAEAAR